MAELAIREGHLKVNLSTKEKFGALQRSDLSVPVKSIDSVERLQNSRDGIRGMRAPGTGWPGVIALGKWRTFKTVDFIAVYKNDPGYLIELTDQRYDRIVVSSPEVPELESMI